MPRTSMAARYYGLVPPAEPRTTPATAKPLVPEGRASHKRKPGRPKAQLWTRDELAYYLNVDRSTTYALEKQGLSPVYLQPRMPRWRPSDGERWLKGRSAEWQ